MQAGDRIRVFTDTMGHRTGPNAEQKYLSNHGEYYTEYAQAWMDIP